MSSSANRADAEWRRHRAARVVAAQARDAEDLAALLDMLGLSAAEGRFPPTGRRHRAGTRSEVHFGH